jgi:hypothetical protein
MARTQPESLPGTARSRLAALGEKKPCTIAAHLRMLWPEINAALERGNSLKAVCECLEADGLKLSVRSLGSYVTRLRRSATQVASVPQPGRMPTSINAGNQSLRVSKHKDESIADQSPPDPLSNLRRSQAKRPAFDYRPELADPDKLI